ncbi:O-antigen ligase domain-containing protein [Rhizobium sp. KAs_5_22]|uniref:O-antigen ligase family protein n=1 Tax=Ciceribacter selenitireducens TaxID=448181 RepID=UPI0004AE6F2C|nr:O-antigen ligase family protein [Ciceribacter selenitireducens]PPJ49396.1 O-antigen ligase domain-containing protein [Rhizobium sp. KAs_5_22]
MSLTSESREDGVMTSRLERALFFAFVAIAVAGLLPRGSVSIESTNVFASLMLVVTMGAAVLLGAPQRAYGLFCAALSILVVMSLWIFLQTVDLSATGFANPGWPEANSASGRSGGTISVAPADTLSALIQIAAPFVAFMGGLVFCHSEARASSMLRALAISAGIVATLSLVQYLVFPNYLLFWEKRDYLRNFTAVFVNRNTAATFLGFTTVLLSGLLWQSEQEGTLTALFRRLTAEKPVRKSRGTGQVILLLCLLVPTFAGLMLTQSRAGIASTFVAMLFFLTYLVATRQQSSRYASPVRSRQTRSRLIAMAAVLAGLIAIGLVFSGRVILRAEVGGMDESRLCVAAGILRAISDYPLTGMGFGTFEAGFPAYRSAECSIEGVWDRAHNFYLEGTLGLGAIFLVSLVIAVGALMKSFMTGLRERRKARIYPAMGIAILILAMLHSALDFSLQLPGLALFFAAVLAPLASISLGRTKRSGSTR